MNRSQKHNKLLVFDLELTCWENINDDGSLDKSPPPEMKNEIIEFGYVILDMKSRNIIEKGSWLIKPNKSTISDFCTKLTGITQERIDREAISFEKFRSIIDKKGWRHIACTSWGYGDMIQFREHCTDRNLNSPLSKSFFCCKTAFGLWTGRNKGWGVKKALDKLNLDFEGTPHSALWDSYNTARILMHSIYKQNPNK